MNTVMNRGDEATERDGANMMAAPVVRVVLAEDHVAFREAFALALADTGEIQVVGQAADARGACAAIEQARPDVLVADLMLKDTDAVALLRELRRRRLRVRTLVLSRHSSPMFVNDAFKAGANGFALKRQGVEELRAAIRLVASGSSYRAPEVEEAAARGGDERAQKLATLSAREREILSRVIEGRSNAEIAQALFISRRTVDSHRNRMNRKLGVNSPLELLRLAAESGLID